MDKTRRVSRVFSNAKIIILFCCFSVLLTSTSLIKWQEKKIASDTYE